MTFETLIIVLAIIAFVFVNVVQPWLRRRRATDPRHDPASAMPDAVHVPAPAAITTAPMPSQAADAEPTAEHEISGRAHAPSAHDMPPALPQRRRRSALGSLADARRGIVLRTILGPCRAQQPFDSPSN